MATDLIKEIEKQIVKTDSLFSVDKSFEDDRFMRVRIAAMHSGINRNNSRFSTETIQSAKDTFANIPILADVQEYEDEDGNKHLDYSGHSMHVEDDIFKEGECRMIYDEKVVGIVPETNNFEIVYDEETGNDYVYVDALLYREYGNYVCDILESRDNKTDVSMEISCDEISYSAKDKCLDVNKMTACAITLLGDHVTPGMAKAHAEVFSISEDDRQTQLIKIMQELTNALDNYTAAYAAKNNITEGGNSKVGKFEELLKQYEKTVEDITFEYDGLSDEELVEAFANAFEEKKTIDDTTPDVSTTPEDEISTPTPEPESTDPEPEPEVETESEPDPTPEVEAEPEVETSLNSAMFTLGAKTYAVSLSDIMYALSELVNDTYSDEGTYYGVEVYSDDSYVIMVDYMTGKAYKQSYKCKKKSSYSLTGDRVPVKAIYVTEDEERELDKIRSTYSSVVEELEKFKAEPDKLEILESKDYHFVAGADEFISLKEQKNHFDLSVAEVKEKADAILLEYVKKCEFKEPEETKQVNKKVFAVGKADNRSRYGGLGKKKN